MSRELEQAIAAADAFIQSVTDPLVYEVHSEGGGSRLVFPSYAKAERLVRMQGYALPQPVWECVEALMGDWLEGEVERAERAAGWDPNP